jgi:DHA1 family tetracycline resistance protein-like MFS transporter
MVMTGTFAAFTAPGTALYLPGAPFLLSAGLVALALFIFVRRAPRASLSV